MIKIWGRRNSSNVQKVLWLCGELGIAYEREDVGGSFGRNREPWYLALNPNGRVPTIQDGAAIIWESHTVMRYLAATHGGEALYPADPVRRAAVETWMDWLLAHLSAPNSLLFSSYIRTPPDRRDPAAMAAAERDLVPLWSILERRLDGRDYLADSFSLGDIGLGIHAHRWFAYPIERPAMPRLEAWYGRLRDRPAFKANIGDVPLT